MISPRILIVEDEVLIAEYLKDILMALDFSQLKLAHSKKQALLEMAEFKPQIILLDIRMEHELEGITLAEEIQRVYKIPFIFITAHSDKEIVNKALKCKPMAYLTKPFKKTDVFAAISILLKHMEEQKEKEFIFKDGYASVRLLCNDLLYIEGEGNYIHIVTSNKKYTIRHSLEWCLEHLPKDNFIRVHRSFIVNLEKVEKMTSHQVFINGKSIPVSRKHRLNHSFSRPEPHTH